MRVLFNRVVVRPLLRKNAGLIHIPDTAKEHDTPCLGEAVAVGDGLRQNGTRQEMSVRVGDRVIFRKHAGKHARLDVGRGVEDLRAIAEEDIDAIVDAIVDGEGEVEVVGMPR